MFNLAGPSALVNAMRIAQLLTDQAVLGHLKYQGKGTACYLDAASLAILWMTLTLTVMTRGVSGTINMLCSQALGAGNRKLSDTWLVTGLILSVAAAAIISALWLLTEDVVSLYAANQTLGSASDHAGSCADGPGDPVKLAASYAIHSTAYTLPTLWTECVNAWLLAERIIRPQLCVYALALVGNLALNIVLVHGIGGWHGLGFLGSPLATTATRVLQLIVLVCLLPLTKVELPRLRFREALKPSRLRTFLMQALPRCVSAALEEIALQACGALAGRLGSVETDAHNSMLMTFFWLTAPLYGVGTATQQRMGYFLGEGQPRAARTVGVLCLYVLSGLSIVVAAVLVATRGYLGVVFSNSPEVVDMVAAITPLVAGAYTVVGLFYASMATLNGQGRPLPVALAFFFGAFLVSPSLAYVLSFVVGCCGSVKLFGLWLGLIAGYSITTLISGAAVLRSDWAHLSKLAQERSEVQHASGQVQQPDGSRSPRDGSGHMSRAPVMEAPLLQNEVTPPPAYQHPSAADAETWQEAD